MDTEEKASRGREWSSVSDFAKRVQVSTGFVTWRPSVMWQEPFCRREKWKRPFPIQGFSFLSEFSRFRKDLCAIIADKLACKKKNQDKELKTERNGRDKK